MTGAQSRRAIGAPQQGSVEREVTDRPAGRRGVIVASPDPTARPTAPTPTPSPLHP